MNLQNKVQKLKDKIKKMRQCGLEENGQYSIENLAFKVLRRNGYLEKLSKIGIKSYDKQYSIKEKDITKEEDNFERKETHGYERGELNKSGYDDSNNENAMGFWGLETGSGESESSSLDKDFSSPSFDSSSEIFDIKESLKKELRKYYKK